MDPTDHALGQGRLQRRQRLAVQHLMLQAVGRQRGGLGGGLIQARLAARAVDPARAAEQAGDAGFVLSASCSATLRSISGSMARAARASRDGAECHQ